MDAQEASGRKPLLDAAQSLPRDMRGPSAVDADMVIGGLDPVDEECFQPDDACAATQYEPVLTGRALRDPLLDPLQLLREALGMKGFCR